MLQDITPLPLPAPFSATAPALSQNVQPDQTVRDRPVRTYFTNRTNRTIRSNIRLCVDGILPDLKPSVDVDFLLISIIINNYNASNYFQSIFTIVVTISLYQNTPFPPNPAYIFPSTRQNVCRCLPLPLCYPQYIQST